MPEQHGRDLIGYGATPPDPKWPGGARLALNFVINYEEGSEYSIADGDGFSEVTLTEMLTSPVACGARDFAAESMFEYGSRVGVWRLMRMFGERGIPATVFASALALQRNPLVAKSIVSAGYDVCAHGWRWIEHFKLSEEEERRHIQLAVETLQKLVGERPLGWYCRYGPSANTRRLLVEEGGFLYDSDAYNDELPYWINIEGEHHLVIPHTLTNNDAKFGRFVFGPGADFLSFLKDAFDVLYREGETMPRMMTVSLHARLTGHPGRSSALSRFLDYIRRFDDVWICRRVDIARHWSEYHPYDSC
jgi:allantoinase